MVTSILYGAAKLHYGSRTPYLLLLHKYNAIQISYSERGLTIAQKAAVSRAVAYPIIYASRACPSRCRCILAWDFNSQQRQHAQGALAQRLEKYARASGHPRLVELLSRHAEDQKDKFTLSDDEEDDEASDAL